MLYIKSYLYQLIFYENIDYKIEKTCSYEY